MLNPFPSAGSKSRSSKFAIAARTQLDTDEHPRLIAVCFADAYGAKHWLDSFIATDTPKQLDERTLILEPSGIKVDSPQLAAIMGYVPTKEEGAYRFPEERYRAMAQFRRGPWDAPPQERPQRDEDPVERAPKVERAKRAERPAGYVTVADISKQLKVKPFDVRQALRNSGAVKPEYGWAFDPKEVEAIKKLMEKTS